MIAIVGGGVAGWTASQALQKLGCEDEVRIFAAEADAPYERPALSKGFLTDAALEHPPPLPASDDHSPVLELGIEVVGIDPELRRIETADGRSLDYGSLLLATGARARRLEISGADLAGIHYLREASDARGLRPLLQPGTRLVVVGGGVIGLEAASSANSRGCEVTVIEAAERLIGRVAPAELAAEIERLHAERGVTIRTGAQPTALAGEDGMVRGVVLDGDELIAADVVLVGIGVQPRTELAERSGLAVENGIVVDQFFRSSDPHIFAAGDAASVFHVGEDRHVRAEQWRSAQVQGRRAAASMMGAPQAYDEVPWMWSDQYDFHMQASGFGFDGVEAVGRGEIDERGGLVYFGLDDRRLVAACGISRGTGVARIVRLAETLIQRQIPIDVEALRDPAEDLQKLLKQSVAAVA